MPKTQREITISAPIEQVFRIITDYERYPDFLPEINVAKVLSREGGIAIVEFELEIIMRISYTLRLQEQAPHGLSWSLERAKMVEYNSGGWALRETPEGHTHAVYELDIGLRGLIPKSVSNKLLGETLPHTLARFKERAESNEAG